MPSLHPTLNPAKRADLKAQAHALKPVVMIGPEGLTDAVIHEIDLNLNAHKLIKIRMFEDVRTQREEAYQAICTRLNAHAVQHIGKLFVIWRPDATNTLENTPTRAPQRSSAGAPPRKVTVFKRRPSSLRRTTRKTIQILGNQRVTKGGSVKRAKPRLSSIKKKF